MCLLSDCWLIPGLSGLHLAAKNSQPECLKRLLQVKWFNPNAVKLETTEILYYYYLVWPSFKQERLSVDCTDSIGRTPLHHAGKSNWTSLRRLIKATFYTVLIKLQSLTLYAALSGCLSCAEILWDFKANLDAQDEVGWANVLAGLCNVVLDRTVSFSF